MLSEWQRTDTMSVESIRKAVVLCFSCGFQIGRPMVAFMVHARTEGERLVKSSGLLPTDVLVKLNPKAAMAMWFWDQVFRSWDRSCPIVADFTPQSGYQVLMRSDASTDWGWGETEIEKAQLQRLQLASSSIDDLDDPELEGEDQAGNLDGSLSPIRVYGADDILDPRPSTSSALGIDKSAVLQVFKPKAPLVLPITIQPFSNNIRTDDDLISQASAQYYRGFYDARNQANDNSKGKNKRQDKQFVVQSFFARY
jgi:hypothetical protein